MGNNLLVHAQAELEADWQVLSRKQEQNLFKDLQKEKKLDKTFGKSKIIKNVRRKHNKKSRQYCLL